MVCTCQNMYVGYARVKKLIFFFIKLYLALFNFSLDVLRFHIGSESFCTSAMSLYLSHALLCCCQRFKRNIILIYKVPYIIYLIMCPHSLFKHSRQRTLHCACPRICHMHCFACCQRYKRNSIRICFVHVIIM